MKTLTKTTLAIGIFCLFAFAQTEKPKAAVYIKGNPEGRDALRMAVNTFLIKSQKYQMIAVDAIDVVAEEQNRQRGGSVSNEDIAQLGKDAGAQYVCVVEKSESDGVSYVSTSMVSVQSKIAELSDMSELPRGVKIINLIEKQIHSMLGISPEPPTPPKAEPPPIPIKQTAQINEKPKAAVYIKGNPEGRDALRMAVNTFLIKSQKYQMIAVDAIDLVAQEQQRQASGNVSNEDIAQLGRDAGAQYVCVVEKSESDGISYVSTSMVSVQSKIAELSEMSELPKGEKIINLIEKQINSMLGIRTPEPTPSYSISSYLNSQNENYNAPASIDNGLGKSKAESEKSIWPSIALSIAGAGLVYTGVYFKKKSDKYYNEYYSLDKVNEEEYDDAWAKVKNSGKYSGWGFGLGGLFLTIGIFSLINGGF